MANVDNPHGLGFVGMDGPGVPFFQTLKKLVGIGTAIFPQDVVARASGGGIAPGGTPGTTNITGVAGEFGAASLETEHKILVSPFALFEAQDNNDTDGIAAADLGLNANLEYNAGSTTRNISGHEIDESTAATTNTLDVHLVELLPQVNNDHGSFARIVLRINKHRYGFAVAGV